MDFNVFQGQHSQLKEKAVAWVLFSDRNPMVVRLLKWNKSFTVSISLPHRMGERRLGQVWLPPLQVTENNLKLLDPKALHNKTAPNHNKLSALSTALFWLSDIIFRAVCLTVSSLCYNEGLFAKCSHSRNGRSEGSAYSAKYKAYYLTVPFTFSKVRVVNRTGPGHRVTHYHTLYLHYKHYSRDRSNVCFVSSSDHKNNQNLMQRKV